jgi:putative ABC transport system ATP-binding protein
MQAGLSLDGVRATFPGLAEPALDIPALHVARGALLAVAGPSGSGKSTFVNLVTGLDRPAAGKVVWDGTDISALPEGQRDRWRAEHVGLVMQDFHLLPGLDALDNVLLPARLGFGRLPSGLPGQARALLDRVGVQTGERRLETLSRGEMQRIAIARALLRRPDIVVADEPTASLDAEAGARVTELLVDLAAETGFTLIAVSHDEGLLSRMQRRLTLRGGRIVADDGGGP